VEFNILGPLTVRCATGEPLEVSRPRLRGALCVLLLNTGRYLSRKDFIESLWGADAPRDPEGALRSNIYILRKTLGLNKRLQTKPNSYTLELCNEDRLDLQLFNSLTDQAQVQWLAGNAAATARLLERALAIWGNPPLTDVPATLATQPLISELLERRAAAEDVLVDAKLALGQHRALLPWLISTTSAAPLREHRWEQLMLTLYRCGRQAEALDAFSRARRILTEDCGIEPGMSLQRLQRAILAGDPALHQAAAGLHSLTSTAGAAVPLARTALADRPDARWPQWEAKVPPAWAPIVAPCQLPAAPRDFIGRDGELAILRDFANRLSPSGSSPVVSAICGPPGVGKTALALHFGHEVSDRFPDGQIYINLGAFGPGCLVSTAQAIRSVLEALGIPAPKGEMDPAAQASAYRTMLAHRRVLIVIDNALDSAQVRSLLPASSQCMVIVTGRLRLTGLVTSHSAHMTILDVLSPEDASELVVRRLAINHRVVDQAVLSEVSASCAGLPLALVTAAAKVVARPAISLSDLASDLRQEENKLHVLNGASGQDDVRTVLSWSYARLSAEEARMFRALGRHPGQDITAASASRCAETSIPQAKRALDGLATASLIKEHAPGVFRFQPLMDTYAAEKAADEATPAGGMPKVDQAPAGGGGLGRRTHQGPAMVPLADNQAPRPGSGLCRHRASGF
jgi:DNA-binding SARP family transcriptional activator